MLMRSKSIFTAAQSPALNQLLNSKFSGILLFLLLAIGFVTTAKVLVSPLLTPIPSNQPELAVDLSKPIEPAVNQTPVNCPPTALAARLTS